MSRVDAASRLIAASPERLYGAFADAAALMRWLPPKGMNGRAIEYDFRVGGRYRIELRSSPFGQKVSRTIAKRAG